MGRRQASDFYPVVVNCAFGLIERGSPPNMDFERAAKLAQHLQMLAVGGAPITQPKSFYERVIAPVASELSIDTLVGG
jgi:hypothetical protein